MSAPARRTGLPDSKRGAPPVAVRRVPAPIVKLAIARCLFLLLAGVLWRADATAADRLFFPSGSVRGLLDFQFAPPHNEIDLGLCAPWLGSHCSAYARYLWSGYFEMRPFGRSPLRRLFFFTEPKVFGGENVPQQRYSAAASLILWERVYGAGVKLPAGFELRYTHHGTELLGRFRDPRYTRLVKPDGPYGLNNTIGVRWYFGDWSRSAGRSY